MEIPRCLHTPLDWETGNPCTDQGTVPSSVSLVGFGTFSVKARAARMGRNPRTGEAIQIKASNVPGFKAGKALKDAVN